jgi:hypothetical protein
VADERTAAQTRVRVDFRQIREALAASEQADQVFEGLLVACVELQDENERLREALERIMLWTPNPPGISGYIALGWIRGAAREALNRGR